MMRFAYLVSAGLALAVLAPISAQTLDVVSVTADPWQGETDWYPSSGTPVGVSGALHGTATVDGSKVTYSPDPGGDFWTVGSERLLVTLSYADQPGTVSLQRLAIIAGSPTVGPPTTDFEGEDLPVIHGLDTQIFVGPEGALLGSFGARLVLDGGEEPAYLEYRVDDDFRGDPDNTDAGCADLRMGIDDPDRDGLPGCFHNDEAHHCGAVGVISAVSADGFELFRVEAGLATDTMHLRALAFYPGGVSATPWVESTADPHAVRLDWWTGVDGGLRLRIDGRVRGELRGLPNEGLEVSETRIGAPVKPPGSAGQLKLDAITVRGGHVEPDWEPVTTDGFEQDFAGWPSIGESAGPVSITSSAALAGDTGLEVDLGPSPAVGWGSWILDREPGAETSMGLRFRLDTEDLAMGPGETASLVLGQITDGPGVENRFLIRLWNQVPQGVKMRASARDDANFRFDLPYALLSPGKHLVELSWQAASQVGNADGRLRLWIDGVFTGEFTDLANPLSRIESVRFGAMFLQEGTGGQLRLDEFESWRRRPAPDPDPGP